MSSVASSVHNKIRNSFCHHLQAMPMSQRKSAVRAIKAFTGRKFVLSPGTPVWLLMAAVGKEPHEFIVDIPKGGESS